MSIREGHPRGRLRADLGVLGLRLLGTTEDCVCEVCRMLDLRFDVDALAADEDGRPIFVSWRETKDSDWDTLTIRASNDNGSDDVQLQKILDGRSRADLFVHSYPTGFTWADAQSVRAACVVGLDCVRHPQYRRGNSGQTFLVLCAKCCPGLRDSRS